MLALLLTALTSGQIDWLSWSPAVAQRAAQEQRLVLLDVEAVWCHWCHVMDATTYRDPAVARLLGQHFLAVKVDQDAMPSLAVRYERWGWPATVILAPAHEQRRQRPLPLRKQPPERRRRRHGFTTICPAMSSWPLPQKTEQV